MNPRLKEGLTAIPVTCPQKSDPKPVLGLDQFGGRSEARAALVRQRAGLFGVMAVLGLALAIIAPFLGGGLM